MLYSNSANDKLKLLSLKKSLLIIDEVQTIPKFILGNFMKLLSILSDKLDCYVLFVSATVPPAIRSCKDIYILEAPSNIESEYLKATRKLINYYDHNIDINELSSFTDGPNLVMVNTRRKAVGQFQSLGDSKTSLLYMSSGVKKIDRKERINVIRADKLKSPITLISTQVIEAGVDISFKRMYRELAPLDNIVQAMGRLNRESESDVPPILNVFEIDRIPIPYIDLEIIETREILKKVKDSCDVYSVLPSYYASIQSKNLTAKGLSNELDELFKKMDFRRIWDFVNSKIFQDAPRAIVYLPAPQKVKEFAAMILNHPDQRAKILQNNVEITAELPIPIKKVEDYVNPDLLELEILLPTESSYDLLYDKTLGLDIHLAKQFTFITKT